MDRMVTENKYLSFSSLKQLNFWDYYTLSNKSQIHSKFELVELSVVLTQRKEPIVIDDNLRYKRCRVQTRAQGVILRDEVFGKEIKTKKQQLCKEDDFLVAEIDAKVGGYGIVPDYLEGAIVSGHYFLFEIDKKRLLPDFLSILVKCNDFSKQVKATGSTNYAAIRPYHVLGYLIPLPSIEEQNRIVKAYNSKIKLAEEQEQKASELEEGIEEYLFESLHIEKQPIKEQKNSFSFINYCDISIWAVWNVNNAYKSTKYQNITLGSILKMKSGSFLPAKNQISGKYNVYGGNGITGTHKEWQHEGKRIIIGRVGKKCGNVHLVSGKYWVTDNAFLTDKVDNEFSDEYLEIVLELLNLNRFKVISAQPSLSQQNLINVPVPKPSLNVQEAIVEFVSNIKMEIDKLKKKSKKNIDQAKIEFENTIFEPCN